MQSPTTGGSQPMSGTTMGGTSMGGGRTGPGQMGGGAAGRQMGGGMQQGRTAEPILEPVDIQEIIEEDVVTVQEDDTVGDTVSEMAQQDVGSVVVVDDDENPTGIVTDRKVALALEDETDIVDETVDEVATEDLVTATTDMNAFEALEELSNEEIRRLPIVDEDGELQGIITIDDLLVLLESELHKIAETISAQSPRL